MPVIEEGEMDVGGHALKRYFSQQIFDEIINVY